MADWNCVSKSLNRGANVYNGRTNGVNTYGIQVEHLAVEGGSVDLEIDFRNDWSKSTENVTLSAGGKRTYTDTDSGKWEVAVVQIIGDGVFATAVVSVCYYGNPYAQITNLIYPSSAKEGDEFDCSPSVCNTGNLGGSFDIRYYEGTTLIKTVQQGRIDAGECFENLAGRLTMPDHDLTVTVKMCLRGTTTCYDERTVTIKIETVAVGNGFTIRVSNALVDKTITVGHVVKIIGTDLWYWPKNFGYVGGQWYFAKPATTYRIEVGSIFETIPPFNETYGTGSFADGIHCVVLAEGASGVNTLIFKDEDVFQLFADSPTEINLSSVSNDIISEAIMGPVCDYLGIPRGSECNAFWAEFYDPVYVANYVSIMRTGKDTLGNTRELSGFDHIALPFAILGSLPGLSLLPFGALVTKGLATVSKTGAKFSDAAVQFMLNFSMDAANKISSKDTWHFLDAIGQVTEGHADEIVNALTAGDTTLANTLLRKYAGESKGWWDYHKLNDMLKGALPTDAYNWLRTQIGLNEVGAGIVTNVAKQVPPLSADDVAKLADAALDTGVMDEATSAVYKSIFDLESASPAKRSELFNILANDYEIHKAITGRYHTILWDIGLGGDISEAEIRTILNHCALTTDDISYLMVERLAPILRNDIVSKLSGDTYRNVMANFIDTVGKHYDTVLGGGTAEELKYARQWMKNNAELARKALDSTAPAKMADIPKAAQDLAAKQGGIIDDAVAANPKVSKVRAEDILFGLGRKSADEIIDTTQAFADDVPTNWFTKARQRAAIIPNRIKAKWAGLERYEKVLCIWFMVDNVAFIVYMIAKFLGLGPGDRGFAAWNLGKSATDAKWLCKESCEDKRYSDLESNLALFEVAINNLEVFLDKYEFSLKLSNSYNAPKSVLDICKASLKLYQECLVNRGIEIAPSTGKIVFFAIDSDRQAVVAGAYVDGWRVGTIWGSGLEISEVDPGSYDLEVKASGYIGCTKTVNVVALKTETFECTLQQIGACSPVTDVKIYIDPLSPVADEVVSFNGSASSKDPITKWEWKFGDGFTATGQAVTHPYSSKGIYTVELKVTNDCEEFAITTRNVTVSEEEPPTESTTLQIQTPIGTNGAEIPRYWEIEIWVDGKDTACNPPKTLTFGTGVFCDCTSPWNLVPCELGTHTITLKKHGYDDKSISVYLEKDTPKTWHSPVMVVSTAPPTTHTISIVVPVGSSAWVDGKQLT